MKKLSILIVAALAFALLGCRKSVEVSFAVATQSIVEQGGTVEVALKSNGEWTIAPTVEWLTVSPMSGSGDATLTLTAAPNTSGVNRETEIKASTKDNSAEMTVTQGAMQYYVMVTPHTIQCDAEGGEYTVEVSSNIEWVVITPQWVTSSVTSGANNATITLTVSPIMGEEMGPREGEVLIGNLSTVSDRISIVQNVTPAMPIEITPKILTVVCTGETKSVSVATEDSWTASVEEDWVVLSQTEGQGNAEVDVTIGENPVYTERHATVHFVTAEGLSAYLFIHQEASPDPHFLEVSPLTVQFGKEGGESPIALGCDTDWVIDSDAEWLSVTPTFGSGNATVNLVAAPNPISEGRTVMVLVKSGDLSYEVTVSQEAGDEPMVASFVPDVLNVPYNGGLQHVSLTSNTSWVLNESCDWITLLATTSGEGDASFDILLDANSDTEERTGYVNAMHNGQVLATLTVVQEAWTSILETSLTEIEVRPEGGDYTIQVTANQSWMVVSDVAWMSCTPTSGYHDGELVITVEPLLGTRPRTGHVMVKGSTGASVEITVIQNP